MKSFSWCNGVALRTVFVLAIVALAGWAVLVLPLEAAPIYQQGNLTFSENVTVHRPGQVTGGDGEPSIRVDIEGNCYVGGIRGVPAGVDLWRFDLDPGSPNFDPGLQEPVYLGQPDAFMPQNDPDSVGIGGSDGGGDIDISVSFPTDNSIPVVTITSLAAANVSSAVSFDRGETFTLSPAVVPVPADDRQWNESTGPNRVYLLYRAPIPATGLFVVRSDDNGLTYPVQGVVNPSGTTPGYIDVDHATGRVYVAHMATSSLSVGISTDSGLTWTNRVVDNSMAHGELFDVVKVGNDGTVYTVWCNARDIFLSYSTNQGQNWSSPIKVNDDTVYQTNLFPWLEAGAAGRVNVIWYGTTAPNNVDSADWVVLFTQCLDVTSPNPTFRQQVISDGIIHGSNISTGGLTGGGNRNLLDYFQVAIDPQGAAVVAFTDDHNDFGGNSYVTRQLDGPSLNGGQVNPVIPPPLPDPDPSEPEVSDFVHDAASGLVQPVPEDHAADILWIDYACDTEPALMIVATMKVSGPPTMNRVAWRMSFTANAPGGVSDRGDQFWVRANSNEGTPTYSWGTTVRNHLDGTLTYTQRGPADLGVIDVAERTITVGVLASQLNPLVTHGPPIGTSSVIHGTRGQATVIPQGGTGFPNAYLYDDTRGGRSFSCATATAVSEEEAVLQPVARFLGAPQPNPASRGSSVRFAVARPGFVELSVIDATGRRVRTIQAGALAPGEYTRGWDGRTDRFADAAAGIYFYVLNTSSGTWSEKITLLR